MGLSEKLEELSEDADYLETSVDRLILELASANVELKQLRAKLADCHCRP